MQSHEPETRERLQCLKCPMLNMSLMLDFGHTLYPYLQKQAARQKDVVACETCNYESGQCLQLCGWSRKVVS